MARQPALGDREKIAPEMVGGQFLPARRRDRRAKFRKRVLVILDRPPCRVPLEFEEAEKIIQQTVARRTFQSVAKSVIYLLGLPGAFVRWGSGAKQDRSKEEDDASDRAAQ